MSKRKQIRKEPSKRTMELFNKFRNFHLQNPNIWELFKAYSFKAIEVGLDHYSARAIFHRIRWEVNIETTDHKFKLSNNHSTFYARMFHIAFPNHDGFFRNRASASSEQIQKAKFLKLIKD